VESEGGDDINEMDDDENGLDVDDAVSAGDANNGFLEVMGHGRASIGKRFVDGLLSVELLLRYLYTCKVLLVSLSPECSSSIQLYPKA
jgi:hypothetical protein